MFKKFFSFIRNLIKEDIFMKTIIKPNIQLKQATWEILCDNCASIAEKKHWNEKDSEKVLKEVRKNLREQ